MSKLCASTLRCAFSIWLREHAALDDLAFLHAGHGQPALRAIRIAEDAHEVVFHRQIEAAGARIALAARTAAQLVVDAARFMALGADDVQATGGDHLVVARLPVGADARGGDFIEPRFARAAAAAASSSASLLPPSLMSVPRPAMFVAMVTLPGMPAFSTMCASRSCCLAFSTSCGMPCFLEHAGEQLRSFRWTWCPRARAARASRSLRCPR